MRLVARAGLLATKPQLLPKKDWPPVLYDSALAVYALAEPVIATGSFVAALAGHHRGNIFLYEPSSLRFDQHGVHIGKVLLRPRSIVLTAGAGNGELLAKAGVKSDMMQLRPLGMVLLRGNLPELFGHCVIGGKTGLTITTPAKGVWQIGGEIAETLAGEQDRATARRIALREVRRWLTGPQFKSVEIALYQAVRAEARTATLRRPSGVHASQVAPGVVIGWPTKLSMAPVLADEIFHLVQNQLEEPRDSDDAIVSLPAPAVARYPWEKAEWYAAN
jgi:hypothetical protein